MSESVFEDVQMGELKTSGEFIVSKTSFGEEEESIEEIKVSSFLTAPAIISVKGGATINLGDYEFGRIDIMLTMPCYKEEVAEIFPRVQKFVDDRMAIEYKEMKKSVKK